MPTTFPETSDAPSKEKRARASRRRALFAILWIYGALLAGLVWILYEGERGALGRNPVAVLVLLVATIGLAVLGRGSFREAWGRRPSSAWLAAAPLCGLAILVLSVLWVRFSGTAAATPLQDTWPALGMLVFTTALVAYTEEFLFRGALWAALMRRNETMALPILQSSMLFAIAHVFGAGTLLELPHRFVAGLILGYMRARSGSLWPCIHVHFFVNLSAHLVR